MDRDAFVEMVTAEGYTAVDRTLEPGMDLDEHDHAWDSKGLILDGAFTVHCVGEESRTYSAGEIFVVAAGVAHTEGTGPDGAHLMVGRRKIAG